MERINGIVSDALGSWYQGEREARLTWHGTVWAGILGWYKGEYEEDRKRYERRDMMKIRCEGEMLRTRWLSPP
jgi:hypothetical protein